MAIFQLVTDSTITLTAADPALGEEDDDEKQK
jgi:hypothetical protein